MAIGCSLLNITLSSEYGSVVEEQIRSGRFGSPEEVVCAALRLFTGGPERTGIASKEELNAKIQEGLDDLTRGAVIPGDVDEARLRERSQRKRATLG